MRRIIAASAVTALATGATLLLSSSPTTAATQVASSLTAGGPATAPCATPSPTVNAPAGSTVRFTSTLISSGTAQVTDLVYAPAIEITFYPNTSRAAKAVISPGHNVKYYDFKVPSAGSVAFQYMTGSSMVGSGGLLGGVINLLSALAKNFKAASGIGADVSAKWTGKIVVGNASNSCQLAPQLPGVSVQPTVPGVNLPGITVPGVTVPGVPVPSLPNTGGNKAAPKTTKPSGSSTYLRYKPLGGSVADGVVPKGYGSGSGAANQYVPPGLNDSVNAGAAGKGGTSAKPASAPKIKSGGSPKTVNLATNLSRSALNGIPGLLVILAIFALSGATAFYARTFLLHRPSPVKIARIKG
jgi:hypothetical protein